MYYYSYYSRVSYRGHIATSFEAVKPGLKSIRLKQCESLFSLTSDFHFWQSEAARAQLK